MASHAYDTSSHNSTNPTTRPMAPAIIRSALSPTPSLLRLRLRVASSPTCCPPECEQPTSSTSYELSAWTPDRRRALSRTSVQRAQYQASLASSCNGTHRRSSTRCTPVEAPVWSLSDVDLSQTQVVRCHSVRGSSSRRLSNSTPRRRMQEHPSYNHASRPPH